MAYLFIFYIYLLIYRGTLFTGLTTVCICTQLINYAVLFVRISKQFFSLVLIVAIGHRPWPKIVEKKKANNLWSSQWRSSVICNYRVERLTIRFLRDNGISLCSLGVPTVACDQVIKSVQHCG